MIPPSPNARLKHIMDSLGDGCEVSAGSSNNEEFFRSCRNKRKHMEPVCCPVCSVTLRSSEVESHLESEIDKLYKLSSTKSKQNGKMCMSSASGIGNSTELSLDKCWETYQKVHSNRQGRLRVKSRKRRPEDIICPVCNKETSEDIIVHVDMCLRRSESNSTESDENIDVESFEEYEWAGQSRVRATSMLSGGVSSLGTSISMTEEDEDLVVDGDDTQIYGSPQYSERDMILPTGGKEDALRKAVIGRKDEQKSSEFQQNKGSCGSDPVGDPVLEALKNKIRELESREVNKEEVFKCLICMERYHTPVISVCCWHVHCEQCWLQTLGAKKLCPQCNMITSPSDLRRIYM